MLTDEEVRTSFFKFLNNGYIFDERYATMNKKGKVYGKCEHGYDIFELDTLSFGMGIPTIKTCCSICEKKSQEELIEMCKDDEIGEEKNDRS